jgi:hypothetical protein
MDTCGDELDISGANLMRDQARRTAKGRGFSGGTWFLVFKYSNDYYII